MVRGEHQDDVIGSLILPNRKGMLGEIRCSVFIYAKMVITWVISYFVKRHKKPGKANGLTQSLIFFIFSSNQPSCRQLSSLPLPL